MCRFAVYAFFQIPFCVRLRIEIKQLLIVILLLLEVSILLLFDFFLPLPRPVYLTNRIHPLLNVHHFIKQKYCKILPKRNINWNITSCICRNNLHKHELPSLYQIWEACSYEECIYRKILAHKHDNDAKINDNGILN